MKNCLWLILLCLFGVGACGAEPQCQRAADCANAGDGLCLGGRCLTFGPDEFAAAVVDVSFPRDMVNIPKSGLIYFLHARTADGQLLDCARLEADPGLVGQTWVNHLLVEPRRLSFNCCGNFFPDNLVQRIRPADNAIMLGLAFPTTEPAGNFNAFGCVEGLVFSTAQQPDLLLAFRAR
jgi:hypothetical protein